MGSTAFRRVGAGVLSWLLGIGVFAAVAHPESCPPPSPVAARAAVVDAVSWIGENQSADGRFLYRYDRRTSSVVPGYVIVRHAGTLLALEQARSHGVAGAAEAADRGTAWALAQLTELEGGRAALTDDVGGTALLVAALVEHRRAADDRTHDEVLGALGRFLASAVTDDGAVVATWDLAADAPIAGSRSPFFTGEVLLALAMLHTDFPDGGWDHAAARVGRYVATRRDDVERAYPPVSDHWSSYAFAEMATWPGEPGASLTVAERAYARRQAGLFGVQARFESQRRDAGLARLTRGPVALPAGIGTVGEGLGGVRRLLRAGVDLGVDAGTVDTRLGCVAGLLVERQAHSDHTRVDGAWFRLGFTQVDDQQHALSALLAALPSLEERP